MDEFKLISQFFLNKTGSRPDVLLGIGDDCSLLQAPYSQKLAISTDTMVEGRHFFPDTPAEALGYKALAISLSDLAAMGAEPAWLLLALTLPQAHPEWLSAFSQSLCALANSHNITLVGGNTAQGPLNITTTLLGFVPTETALIRGGAKVGDDIYVSGILGEAGLALKVLYGEISIEGFDQAKANQRLFYPATRINLGMGLRGIASAAIDVSDGLAADLGHILEQSQVGASLYLERFPSSSLLAKLPVPDLAWELALGSGDDYELCFTAPPEQRKAIEELTMKTGCLCSRIGQIDAQTGLRIYQPNGQDFQIRSIGYAHFKEDEYDKKL